MSVYEILICNLFLLFNKKLNQNDLTIDFTNDF